MVEMTIRRFPPLDYRAQEAFNTLCANLSFVGKDIKKILLTSCRPTEGKSSISMELMRAFADLGLKVLLIDADLRASALKERYDIQIDTPHDTPYYGLTRYLAGYCEVDDILGTTNIRGAHMILSGREVTNALPLLSSDRLDMLMDEMGKNFDIVLVDAPPVGAIIDAAKIARCCDGAVFVIKSGLVPKRELLEAMQQMETAGSQILGTVLNQYEEKRSDRGYYYKAYYSRYGSTEKHRRKKPASHVRNRLVRKRGKLDTDK